VTVIRRRIIALALIACSFAAGVARADDDVLEPTRVSAHGWFFEGHPGMASAANRGFMSNAGFVVTDEGVVVFDALKNTGARPRDDRRDPQGDAAADPAGCRQPLSRRPRVWPAAPEGRGRRDLGVPQRRSVFRLGGWRKSGSRNAALTYIRGSMKRRAS